MSFPFLGLELNPPASLELFGREIYFYGILIALGFVLAMLYCAKSARRFGLKEDDVYDFMIWLLPMAILGARLYYVAFSLDEYLAQPSRIFAVWEGGLAIYGGVIAGVITLLLVCRHKKIPAGAFMDLAVYGLLIGQIIGRWGNFMNREAFGAQTEIFCRMGLTAPNGTTIYVHPTFLYESLWNFVLLVALIIFERRGKRRYDGQCALLYFFFYGLGRMWIEGLRSDSLYIGSTGIRVSQLLSLVIVLAALTIMLLIRKRCPSPETLYVNVVKNCQAEQNDGQNV
ncbi:MAG: prolipoprotein diacylglyceryl transferase [Oscillospiraceae bacterium]|nr:prolipoprotein diacylglyceryl transferase [Oscillospiraceae bacterium]